MHFSGIHLTLPFFFMLKNKDIWLKANANVELLEAVKKCNIEDVAAMSRLRKLWDKEEIAVVAELVEARKRARAKLDNYDTIISDSEGVQQATSSLIAAYKAGRFLTDKPIFDLCCGIGSDLRELPAQAIGVDNDSLRCWMAKENTGKIVHCDDATTFKLPSKCLIHIDPARRNQSGRIFELESMLPRFSEVTKITSITDGGCIKLSPAVNFEDLESLLHPYEIEYFEENNRVVQAAVWFGSLLKTENKITATSMSIKQSITAEPVPPNYGSVIDNWILEPNVALERAGLHGTLGNEFDATELAHGIGLLTTNENPQSSWFTSFEVLATTNLRFEKVSSALRDFECTQVEVKTRGKTVDPNEWQKKLNKKSAGPLLTIFCLRLGKKRVAIITRRFSKL